MRLSARYLFSLILSLFLLFTLSTHTFAQTKTTLPTVVTNTAVNTNSDVPNNLHNWTQSVMIEVMSSLSCQLTGVDPTNPKQECLGVDQKTGKIGYIKNGGGAIGVLGHMITILYTPPLHTSDYFKNLAQNFGITKKTYAQQAGIGYDSLSPLMGLWSTFRNIVYIIFVIAFIVIGVAIMLRIKIDPRTVMSIQNQIPKIIIGLVLVTFSFAIAGFLVDLMWTLTYLVVNIIKSTDPSLTTDAIKIAQSTNPFSAADTSFGIGATAGNSAGAVGGLIGDVFNNPTGRLIISIITGILGGYLGNSIASLTSITLGPGGRIIAALQNGLMGAFGTAGIASLGVGSIFAALGAGFAPSIAYAIGGIIAYLIIIIALVWALLKIWISLLMAYIYILLDVILVPFWVLGGLLPGSQINFTGWLRDIAANLLAFPATIAMFLIGRVFMDAFQGNATNKFIPPLIGDPTNLATFGSLVGLGIIFITPNIISILKQALKAPKIDSSGLGQAVGAGTGTIMGGVRSVGSYYAKVQTPGQRGGMESVFKNFLKI